MKKHERRPMEKSPAPGRKAVSASPPGEDRTYRGFFNNAVDGFFRSVPEGRFLDVNPAFAAMLGYASPEELLSSLTDIPSQYYADPRDRQRFMEIMERDGSVHDFQYKARRRDGSEISVSVIARAVRGEDGRIAGYEGIVQDVTERRRAEEEIRRYRFMVEHSPSEVYLVHRDGRLAYVNEAAAASLGYTVEEMMALGVPGFDPLYGPAYAEHFDALKAGKVPPFETVHIARDGRRVPKEMRSVYMQFGDGEYICGFGVDITERKRSEEESRQSEARLKSLVHVLQYQSDSIQDFLDYALNEAIGLTGSKIGYIYFYSEERGEFTLNTWSKEVMKECNIAGPQTVYQLDKTGIWGEAVRQRKAIVVNDFRAPHPLKRGYPEGHAHLYRFMTIPVFSGSRIVAVVGVGNKDSDYDRIDELQLSLLMDAVWKVAERKQSEEALQSSQRMYASVIENIQDVYYRTDRRGCLAMTSPSGALMFGYDRPEEMIGIDVQNLWVDPANRPILLAEVARHGRAKDYEGLMKRRDGSVFWASLTVHFYRDEEGNILGTEGVIRDVTERKTAEEAIRESGKRFRDLAEMLPQAVFEFDVQGRFTYVNRFALELYGYTREEFESGVFVLDTVAPQDREKAALNMVRMMKGEIGPGTEYLALRRNGEEFPATIYSTPIFRDGRVLGLRGIVVDMTERKRLEYQLTQAQKLEAVGTLAGGMAHNFNNILMGIQGHVSMMLMKMNPDHPHFERLKSIEDQIQSGADLTRQLLGFARGGKYEMKPLNINLLLARTAEMFARTKKEIVIAMDLDREDLPVLADRSQMEQMFMNLLVNAWQAMPMGGTVFLETRKAVLGSPESLPFEVTPGPYANIAVRDTGAGMDEKTRQRIFEPFFTTKQMGRGTGLGLATVYGIIKGHKGYVTVDSEPGQGTTFNIYLPLAQQGDHLGQDGRG